MVKILFVCLGNICRSPMAEFVCKDLAEKRGLDDKVFIASAATSAEEIGNPVHPGTRKKLATLGISCKGKHAVQLTKSDYQKYDYIIGMDTFNLKSMHRIFGDDPKRKLSLLLDFTSQRGDIADPWYTGNFETTYQDILRGCQGLLDVIEKKLKESPAPKIVKCYKAPENMNKK